MSEIVDLLDELAIHELRHTADELEKLREKLGRDALTLEEWNALVGGSYYLRLQAHKRERSRTERAEIAP